MREIKQRKRKGFWLSKNIIHSVPISVSFASLARSKPFCLHFIRHLRREEARRRSLPLGQQWHLGIVDIQRPELLAITAC